MILFLVFLQYRCLHVTRSLLLLLPDLLFLYPSSSINYINATRQTFSLTLTIFQPLAFLLFLYHTQTNTHTHTHTQTLSLPFSFSSLHTHDAHTRTLRFNIKTKEALSVLEKNLLEERTSALYTLRGEMQHMVDKALAEREEFLVLYTKVCD